MLNKLLEWDRELFIYLNNLGTEQYDIFWSVATDTATWIPLYILFFVLIFLNLPKKEAIFSSLTIVLLLVVVLLIMHVTKEYIGRLRPGNDEEINTLIRSIKAADGYSFFSGHAATSFAITTLVVLFLRKKIRWTWVFYLWPLIFSMSRIYVGVHYPLDILTGIIVGTTLALLCYYLYQKFIKLYIV